MTLTIELTPEQENRLQAAAERRGLEPAEYAQRLLAENLPELPATGAQLLAYWDEEGCLGVFSDRPEDSPELARQLRQNAEVRDWDPA
jgi:hypothetical protein